jgi:hypothetical protein
MIESDSWLLVEFEHTPQHAMTKIGGDSRQSIFLTFTRFGRKTTVLGCHTVRCIGAYLCLYSPLYEFFAIGRVIMGMTSPSVNLTLYIIGEYASDVRVFTNHCHIFLVAEVTSVEWRSTFGVFWNIFGAVGGMLIPIIAYSVRDHFYLMAIYMWPLLFYFAYAL